MTSSEIVKAALRGAVGPSPWYWQTFPPVDTGKGECLLWFHDVADGPGRDFIALATETEPTFYRLCLGVGTRPFSTPQRRLGLWYPENQTIRISCINPDLLANIPRPSRFTKLGLRFYAGATSHDEIEVPGGLSEGSHVAKLPCWLNSMKELLMVGSYRYDTGREITTVFSVLPDESRICLYPQRWFDEMYGHGWEGITRVSRHPETGAIVGDGVRISAFELASDSVTLARWHR